ncbi:MAG: hypothetical protein ACEQSF_01975 [Solirubrobacteraceae bacterium]
MKNGNTFPLLYNNKYESINLPADFNDNVRSIIIERADLNIPVSLVMFKNQNFRGVKKTLTLGPSEKFKEFFLADIQLYNFIFKYKRWDTNISSFRIQK